MINKKKIMLVFGTRPEAIKMAPLILKLKSDTKNFDVKVCVTAQHRQMLDQVLDLFGILPDIDFNVMETGQDLFDVTINVLKGMKKTLVNYNPDIVLVHGDTTTSLSTSIACFYAGIKVGHVEAGLRTNNIYSPFPEEFNRQITSKITKWHFVPTETSRSNLIAESVQYKDITITGNTVIDALYWILNRIRKNADISTRVKNSLDQILPFDWKSNKFILITGHRRENFGKGFLNICEALKDLAMKFDQIKFVYPVHLNPNIQEPVYNLLANIPNIYLIKPLNYEPFVYLLTHSYFVLTDSGGIQEEAPSLGKPVLVMRDVTERPEAVAAGTVELVGTSKNCIINKVSELLQNQALYSKMSKAHNPYGDGKACDRILKVLKNV